MNSDYQPFGYKGEPGTCLWCGRKLHHSQIIDPGSTKPYPENMVKAAQAGRYQDDSFCGLRCGYQFGNRMADLGHRLMSRPVTSSNDENERNDDKEN